MLASTSEPPAPDSERTRFGWDKRYGWGIINAGRAYELLNTKGCVCAGGAFNSTAFLSEQALGGKAQKVIEPCNVSPATKLSCNSLDIHSTYFLRNTRIWQGFKGRQGFIQGWQDCIQDRQERGGRKHLYVVLNRFPFHLSSGGTSDWPTYFPAFSMVV
jgi:hypothetical protein